MKIQRSPATSEEYIRNYGVTEIRKLAVWTGLTHWHTLTAASHDRIKTNVV
jgi:hypothetical protein